jgi:hypothetical protein
VNVQENSAAGTLPRLAAATVMKDRPHRAAATTPIQDKNAKTRLKEPPQSRRGGGVWTPR